MTIVQCHFFSKHTLQLTKLTFLDLSWQIFLTVKELELVSWDVRPYSLTARSLDDPSNQTAGHHFTSQQTVMLRLTTMTIES